MLPGCSHYTYKSTCFFGLCLPSRSLLCIYLPLASLKILYFYYYWDRCHLNCLHAPHLRLVGSSWEAEQTHSSQLEFPSVCLEKQGGWNVFSLSVCTIQSSKPSRPAVLGTYGPSRGAGSTAGIGDGRSHLAACAASSWDSHGSATARAHGTVAFGETNCSSAMFLSLVMNLKLYLPPPPFQWQ